MTEGNAAWSGAPGSSRPTQRRTTSLSPVILSEAKNPYSRPFPFLFRTKTEDADSSACGLRMTKGGQSE